MGPWGTQRAAHHFYQRNEKLKVKTPHERHYLLFCLVNTALVQVHALCEQTFQKQLTAEEPRCTIERYSSPKVRRLLKVLRCFKPAESADGMRKMRHQVDQADFNKLSHALKAKCHVVEQLEQPNAETISVVRNLEQLLHQTNKMDKPAEETATANEVEKETTPTEALPTTPVPPVSTAKSKTANQTHTRRRVHSRRHNRYQHDASETLCALIYCNQNHTARVLFELLAEMSRRDPDLKFLRCQYTTDRVADPTTEPKEAEQEHRRQEEVLKRFRMHDCNVLIGTSVLEEGIDVPKCNLVVRWDPPITYRSYVQCKGRARAAPAYHVMLVAPLQDAPSASDAIQLSDQSHRYICATTNGDTQQEADSDSDDSALPNSSASDPYTFGTARGTVKILNPEVFSNQPPTACDIKLQEIQDETAPAPAVSNLFDTGNSSDDAISLTNTTPSDRSAERRPKQRFQCELSATQPDTSTPAEKDTTSISVDSLTSTTQVLVHQMAQYREIEQVNINNKQIILNLLKSPYYLQLLLSKCANTEPAEVEQLQADRFTSCISAYQPKPDLSTGASVDLGTAIALVNKYCARLPSDTFTKLTALWRCASSEREGITLYQYTLRLPINSPLKHDIVVSVLPTGNS